MTDVATTITQIVVTDKVNAEVANTPHNELLTNDTRLEDQIQNLSTGHRHDGSDARIVLHSDTGGRTVNDHHNEIHNNSMHENHPIHVWKHPVSTGGLTVTNRKDVPSVHLPNGTKTEAFVETFITPHDFVGTTIAVRPYFSVGSNMSVNAIEFRVSYTVSNVGDILGSNTESSVMTNVANLNQDEIGKGFDSSAEGWAYVPGLSDLLQSIVSLAVIREGSSDSYNGSVYLFGVELQHLSME